MPLDGDGDGVATRDPVARSRLTRRTLLQLSVGGVAAAAAGHLLGRGLSPKLRADVFVAKAADYAGDLRGTLVRGLAELGVGEREIRAKHILLKPNLVEAQADAIHVNTHPLLIRAAIEAFLGLGAASVRVGEGDGHRRDSMLVLDESGVGEVLREDRIPFVDLNHDAVFTVPNESRVSRLETLTLPRTLQQVDWIVSMPKLKTHHWAGVTLSMKNLFGLMPGIVYGWPKNVLHWAGIHHSVYDINAAVRPHLSIADGIVGMEGDGPIMGVAKHAGVLVLGRDLPAVDASCCRVMGLDPLRVPYLAAAAGRLGAVDVADVRQRGENLESVRTDFALLTHLDAHRELRLRS